MCTSNLERYEKVTSWAWNRYTKDLEGNGIMYFTGPKQSPYYHIQYLASIKYLNGRHNTTTIEEVYESYRR